MKSGARIVATAGAFLCAAALFSQSTWRDHFSVDKSKLASSGKSAYMILEPGYKLEYGNANGRLVITVTNDTERVDGIETRVVEEREWEDGALIEVSRNFFAIDPMTKDVYYFGEDVDMYRKGKIVSHEGAWRSGVNGARFGLALPGAPQKGMAHYQEVAPKVAMDRAAIVAVDAVVKSGSKTFKSCLKVEETTPLEPGAKEYKFYAPGVGLVKDSDLVVK